MRKPKKKTRKKMLIIVLCIVGVLIISDWVLTVVIYNKYFDQRGIIVMAHGFGGV